MYPSTFGGEACHWAFFSFGRQDDMSLSENGKPTHGNDTPLGFFVGYLMLFQYLWRLSIIGKCRCCGSPSSPAKQPKGPRRLTIFFRISSATRIPAMTIKQPTDVKSVKWHSLEKYDTSCWVWSIKSVRCLIFWFVEKYDTSFLLELIIKLARGLSLQAVCKELLNLNRPGGPRQIRMPCFEQLSWPKTLAHIDRFVSHTSGHGHKLCSW